jgi:polyhydroxyalkanoate synthesis regulator phasin
MPINVPDGFLEGVIDYVEQTSKLFEKQASTDAEVAKRAPEVVDTLIKRGFINENQRVKAIEAVHDPLKVLESLQKTAEAVARRESAPPTLGAAEVVKKANVNNEKNGKSSPDMEAANRRFLHAMGF